MGRGHRAKTQWSHVTRRAHGVLQKGLTNGFRCVTVSYMEYTVRRGFGPGRAKEFFVVEKDGDTLGSVLTGPLETEEQCRQVIDSLHELTFKPLTYIGGHLVGWMP